MGALPVLPSSRRPRKVGVVDIEVVLALAPLLNMYALPNYAFGGDTPCLDAIPPLCPVVAACCKTLPRWFLRHILDFLDPRRARVDCPKCYSHTIPETIWLEPIWLPPDSMWVPTQFGRPSMHISVWTHRTCTDPSQIWRDRIEELSWPGTLPAVLPAG